MQLPQQDGKSRAILEQMKQDEIRHADLAKAAGKQIEVHLYDADHAFANPSGERYNEEAAQQANQVAWSFLEKHL